VTSVRIDTKMGLTHADGQPLAAQTDSHVLGHSA
jgi:hypothetical protein